MLNVLFIAHCSPLLGANRSLVALIDGLLNYGVRATVVFPPKKESALRDALDDRRIPFHELAIPWNCQLLENEGHKKRFQRLFMPLFLQHQSDRIARGAAGEIAKRIERPDCVYTNTSVTDVGHFLSRIMGCAHIWHLREYGWPDYDLCKSVTARSARQRFNAADKVIAISQSVLDYHRVSPDRSQVVSNGVIWQNDLETIRQHRLAHEDANYFAGRFAAMGLIHPTKGQHIAIAAFAKALERIRAVAPNARLEIVGPGDTTNLRGLAAELAIEDRVHFTGPVEDPLSILTASDVHLTCSSMEGFGRVTAEAMACGAIAIGNASGGTVEIIDDGVNGLLYHGEVDRLAETLSAVASSPELRRQLRVAAWQKAASEFTIERYAGRIFPILSKVCHHFEQNGTAGLQMQEMLLTPHDQVNKDT